MTEFICVTGKRPVTLSETTRALCAKSLNGFFGRRALSIPCVNVDDIENFESLSQREKYTAALDRIVKECPIYINDDELLVGSASLGDAIRPVVPAKYKGEHVFWWGANHVTMGFDKALRDGLDSYEKYLDLRLSQDNDEHGAEVLLSMKNCISSLRVWHRRYMDMLDQMLASAPGDKRLAQIRENLAPVPFSPPKTFYQALQSLWFMFAYARLTSNWPGLGRMDEYLWPYLEADLASGRTTLQAAKEQLAHFMIKGCEWVHLTWQATGDAQHYQNIVLGGIDESGRDITNPVTAMILELAAELPIGDFPIAVRINEQTPEHIFELIALNTSLGGGVVAVYNEKTVLKALESCGYPHSEAVHFANDGCWEVQIPGKTWFSYCPFDGYAILQKAVLNLDKDQNPDYGTFEELYAQYLKGLTAVIDALWAEGDKKCYECSQPVPFCELLTEGCARKGLPYYYYGPEYNVNSPHFGGFADTANALLAVKTFVYDLKKYTLDEFLHMLRCNWDGYEAERREVMSLAYWSNDSLPADAIAARLFNDYINICDRDKFGHINGTLYPAGISTFGRQVDWRNDRFAHAFGMKNGDILSANGGPTPGTDLAGITGIIRSHCELDLCRLGGSTALDIKLDPSVFKDTDKTAVVRPLIEGFCNLGGFFMQIDTIDNSLLLKARENPDAYRSLNVRVSGWSARFITLNGEWQDMIIERTAQKE